MVLSFNILIQRAIRVPVAANPIKLKLDDIILIVTIAAPKYFDIFF
jgi:hypothetical protein